VKVQYINIETMEVVEPMGSPIIRKRFQPRRASLPVLLKVAFDKLAADTAYGTTK
jgi:hypothetical protein